MSRMLQIQKTGYLSYIAGAFQNMIIRTGAIQNTNKNDYGQLQRLWSQKRRHSQIQQWCWSFKFSFKNKMTTEEASSIMGITEAMVATAKLA